ncbi:MAG: FxLYD domain-containing protein [Methanolinea sp.]|nr:FxLYD domain-containing protein [Methanolinea sp.]
MSRTVSLVFLIALLSALIALSGCISPEDFQGGTDNPPATASPTPGAIEGSPTARQSTGETTPENVVPIATPQSGYVETPYGYVSYSGLKTTPRITVQDIKAETNDLGEKYIAGRIKNEGSSRIDHITLTVNLYNSNGNLLGNAVASAHFLGPGKVWRFSTGTFPSREYSFFEVAEIFVA